MKNLNSISGEKLGRNQMKSILGGGSGDCTALCQDGTRVTTTSCSSTAAQTACQDHGGASSCAGAAETCSPGQNQ